MVDPAPLAVDEPTPQGVSALSGEPELGRGEAKALTTHQQQRRMKLQQQYRSRLQQSGTFALLQPQRPRSAR